jgi:hypothetical protein
MNAPLPNRPSLRPSPCAANSGSSAQAETGLRAIDGGQAVEDAAIANLVAEWTRLGVHPALIKAQTRDARAMMKLWRDWK